MPNGYKWQILEVEDANKTKRRDEIAKIVGITWPKADEVSGTRL